MTNNVGADMVIPLLGAAGLVTFSLFPTKIIKPIIGAGIFSVFFIATLIVSKNADISMLIAIVAAILAVYSFDSLLRTDFYSAMLVALLALIGLGLMLNVSSQYWPYLFSNSHLNRKINRLRLEIARTQREFCKIVQFIKRTY